MKRFAICHAILISLLSVSVIFAQQVKMGNAETPPTIVEMTREISRLMAEGKSAEEIYHYQQKIFQPSGSGTISGMVFQDDGDSPLPGGANITVYDRYGYYVSSAYISPGNYTYTISFLPAGLFYVQTFPYGNFIGQFYNDAMDWRQATLVRVGTDSQTIGIDFALADGKVITGKIFEDISLIPLTGRSTEFSVYHADAKSESDIYRYYYSSPDQAGNYFIEGLRAGEYKLRVRVDRYEQEFYDNKRQLDEADVLSISAATDTLKFINFLLNPISGIQDGYEPNDNVESAYQMSIGDSVTPQINPAGDIDYFTFNGQAGDSLLIKIKANSISSLLYPFLGLYDSTGISNISGWSSPDIQVVNFRLPYNGRYYCRISNNGPYGGGEEFYYTFLIDYMPDTGTGSISGTVYLDDNQTPYSGQGYSVYLYESETLYYITSQSFQTAQYQIDNVPTGNYKMSIDPYNDPHYLAEWYNDARSVQEATAFSVTASDTVKNIDFILDRGGSISGRLFLDDLSTDHTLGGYLYLYNAQTLNYVYSSYAPPDEEGLYLISRLQPGEYKVGFSADYLLNYEYPMVYYNQVGFPSQGTNVTITIGDTTENINFILLQGGRIQGFVYLPDGTTPLSNDSLLVDLITYDPLSGDIVGEVMENTFAGGYRMPLLFPGLYKFQALAQVSSLASWYYEDGNDYDDVNTSDIEIQAGAVHELNITLQTGEGSISGIVYEEDGITPTDRPGRIFAYDASGHMVQSTTIGFDPESEQFLETGHYRLTGLKSGSYYLMLTFDSMELQQIPNKASSKRLIVSEQQDPEILDRIGPRMTRMKQIWYGEVVVDIDFFRYLFFQNIPSGAVAVTVTEPDDTPNIDFSYIQSAIDPSEDRIIPDEFTLESVYPNPFNPGTTIRYAMPYRSQVTIEIFDILGRKVATVFDQIQDQGWHTVQWNGQNDLKRAVGSGIYIARLRADNQMSSKKLILLR